MDTRILCGASEKGKIVVNKCLDKGIKITTLKLEQLLILMQGTCLAKYNEFLFYENIILTPEGLKIEEVDKDFISFAAGFKEKLQEYHSLLDYQNAIIDDIISVYGEKSTLELSEVGPLHDLANYKDYGIIQTFEIMKVFKNWGYQMYGDEPRNGIPYHKKHTKK